MNVDVCGGGEGAERQRSQFVQQTTQFLNYKVILVHLCLPLLVLLKQGLFYFNPEHLILSFP